MRRTLKLSVKQLVDFACRGGDLVATGPLGPSALQGLRAHQDLQRARTADQQAEVRVSADVSLQGYRVRLSGRIDLLTAEARPPQLAEIKTCLAPPTVLPKALRNTHWAQLKIYGFCYAEELDGDDTQQIELQLIWYNLNDRRQSIDSARFSHTELRAFTEQALMRYLRWQQLIDKQRQAVAISAAALTFPYPAFRPGQRRMAVAIYRTARDGGALLCEAPTGIGKTVSSLFPAVKAVGAGGGVQAVVYLTAKTSGRLAAAECAQRMRDQGLKLTTLVLESKQRACHCSNGSCERNADGSCPLTLGFFDRLPEAREYLLGCEFLDTETVDAAARRFQLCPFELSLQMLPWVHLIICDYNYVFDPLVRLSHFHDHAGRTLLLIDEAHNLVDRARQMYSARLSRSASRQAEFEAASVAKAPLLARRLAAVTRALERYAKQQLHNDSSDGEHDDASAASEMAPKTVTRAVTKCLQVIGADGPATGPGSMSAAAASPLLSDWFRELYRYAVITDLFSDQHRTLLRQDQSRRAGRRREIELKLFCVDAAEWLGASYRLFRATVAFSATLRPQHFYLGALGMPSQTPGLQLASPFAPEHQLSVVCPFVDTRYRAREASLAALADVIYRVFSSRAGNYLVFFPSYAYLEAARLAFAERHPEVALAVQSRDSDEHQRQAFLERFDARGRQLGFAIMGGIYGEGIDYVGERLLGAVVVGTGLPSLGAEQRLIQAGYDGRRLDGFDYAYRFPGFTRVLQTAGRVVRSEADRGVVVLIDPRFRQAFYQRLYPEHWRVRQASDANQLEAQLTAFWRRDDRSGASSCTELPA